MNLSLAGRAARFAFTRALACIGCGQFAAVLLALSFFGLFGSLHAATTLSGRPPIERFVPDIAVNPQNFCVVQDSRGVVFICNADGVLEFDGQRWQLWRLPNREIVRSLAVAADDTLYVGGYNFFGRLKRDLAGVAEFDDLSKGFAQLMGKREFADIWNTVITPEGVYFRGLEDVFFWNPTSKAQAHWRHPGRFGLLQHHDGQTLLQFRGEGFKVRDGNTWRLLPKTTAITTPIFEAVPLADGGLLMMGSGAQWWRLDKGLATVQTMPGAMPPALRFTEIKTLADGSIALGTSDGWVYLLDAALTQMRPIRIASGVIAGLYADRSGGLLVVNERGLFRLAWPTRWSVLANEQGGAAELSGGSLNSVVVWNQQHYALTSSGAYRIGNAPNGTPVFDQMPWGQESLHALHPLDSKRTLLAGAHRLMLLQDGKLTPLPGAETYPRLFEASRFRPGRIYVGTEQGLSTLDTAGNALLVSDAAPADNPIGVTHIAELSRDELMLGTERHGVWRVTLSSDGKLASMQRLGAAEGLNEGDYPETSVAILDVGGGRKQLIASTRAGFFSWDTSQANPKFTSTTLDGLAGLRAPDETLTLVAAPNGDTWAYSATRLFKRRAAQLGSTNPASAPSPKMQPLQPLQPPNSAQSAAWQLQDIHGLRSGVLANHFIDNEGRVVFVDSHALLIEQPDLARAQTSTQASATAQAGIRLQLRSVTRILEDGKREAVALSGDKPVSFEMGDFGLRFEFALPDYQRAGSVRYRGRLLGQESELSEWATPNTYTYSSLTAGSYRLEIQGMNAAGQIFEMTPFSLEIVPPWYASNWAKALYFLCSLAFLSLAVLWLTRSRTQRLVLQNAQLETKVQARTLELAEANQRLDMMAYVDGLTGVANRRRFDEYLQVAWQNCVAQQRPLAVLLIDVDRFKQFNDEHGHLAGDAALKNVAQQLVRCLRRSEDLLARYGGEEFVVVMPGAALGVAAQMAEKMRAAIELTGMQTTDSSNKLAVTISAGVSSHAFDSDEPLAALIARADAALYSAKNTGRNRVVELAAPAAGAVQLAS